MSINFDKPTSGLNRLSASVRIWTDELISWCAWAHVLVLIAFRLQSEFGRDNDRAQAEAAAAVS